MYATGTRNPSLATPFPAGQSTTTTTTTSTQQSAHGRISSVSASFPPASGSVRHGRSYSYSAGPPPPYFPSSGATAASQFAATATAADFKNSFPPFPSGNTTKGSASSTEAKLETLHSKAWAYANASLSPNEAPQQQQTDTAAPAAQAESAEAHSPVTKTVKPLSHRDDPAKLMVTLMEQPYLSDAEIQVDLERREGASLRRMMKLILKEELQLKHATEEDEDPASERVHTLFDSHKAWVLHVVREEMECLFRMRADVAQFKAERSAGRLPGMQATGKNSTSPGDPSAAYHSSSYQQQPRTGYFPHTFVSSSGPPPPSVSSQHPSKRSPPVDVDGSSDEDTTPIYRREEEQAMRGRQNQEARRAQEDRERVMKAAANMPSQQYPARPSTAAPDFGFAKPSSSSSSYSFTNNAENAPNMRTDTRGSNAGPSAGSNSTGGSSADSSSPFTRPSFSSTSNAGGPTPPRPATAAGMNSNNPFVSRANSMPIPASSAPSSAGTTPTKPASAVPPRFASANRSASMPTPSGYATDAGSGSRSASASRSKPPTAGTKYPAYTTSSSASASSTYTTSSSAGSTPTASASSSHRRSESQGAGGNAYSYPTGSSTSSTSAGTQQTPPRARRPSYNDSYFSSGPSPSSSSRYGFGYGTPPASGSGSAPSFAQQQQQPPKTSSSNAHSSNAYTGSSTYGTSSTSSSSRYDIPKRPATAFPGATANASTQAKPASNEATVAHSAWDSYVRRWASLTSGPYGTSKAGSSSSSLRPLRFGDFPWPIWAVTGFDTNALTTQQIGSFILNSHLPGGADRKERLRSVFMTWHPDKFTSRWMDWVDEKEKEAVRQGVLAVTRALNELKDRA